MIEKVSLRAYARHRKAAGLPGGTLNAVRKRIEAGSIAAGPDGLIDIPAADAAWEAGVSPDAMVRRDVASMTKGATSQKSAGTKANKRFLAARDGRRP
jgi:hypothetical protein